jgi:heptosyltransferase-2
MRIVVRVPNWIGDVMFSLPALESLKANYPDAEIWLAGASWLGELLAGEPWGARVLPSGRAKGPAGLRAAARDLRERGFDLGLLLTNSFGSAALFALAKIPQRWGYKRDGRGFLLTKGPRAEDVDPPIHMVGYYLRLLEKLGLRTIPPEIRLSVIDGERERARTDLEALGISSDRPLVVLNPGAAYGPAKRWPAARFGELARLFQERNGADIAVTGAASDAGLAAEIGAALARKPADLTGRTTLRGLLGVMSRAAVVVTNDTGPMHMANALRIPVVGLFGPTDPRATAPFHPPAAILKHEGVPCWPCFYRECPYDHRCLTAVTAEEAFAAAEELLR